MPDVVSESNSRLVDHERHEIRSSSSFRKLLTVEGLADGELRFEENSVLVTWVRVPRVSAEFPLKAGDYAASNITFQSPQGELRQTKPIPHQSLIPKASATPEGMCRTEHLQKKPERARFA